MHYFLGSALFWSTNWTRVHLLCVPVLGIFHQFMAIRWPCKTEFSLKTQFEWNSMHSKRRFVLKRWQQQQHRQRRQPAALFVLLLFSFLFRFFVRLWMLFVLGISAVVVFGPWSCLLIMQTICCGGCCFIPCNSWSLFKVAGVFNFCKGFKVLWDVRGMLLLWLFFVYYPRFVNLPIHLSTILFCLHDWNFQTADTTAIGCRYWLIDAAVILSHLSSIQYILDQYYV